MTHLGSQRQRICSPTLPSRHVVVYPGHASPLRNQSLAGSAPRSIEIYGPDLTFFPTCGRTQKWVRYKTDQKKRCCFFLILKKMLRWSTSDSVSEGRRFQDNHRRFNQVLWRQTEGSLGSCFYCLNVTVFFFFLLPMTIVTSVWCKTCINSRIPSAECWPSYSWTEEPLKTTVVG